MQLINPRGIYGLWLRDVTRFLRTPSRILGTMATPIVFLVFLSFGFREFEVPGIPEDIRFIQFLVPGIIGFSIVFGASLAGLAIIFDQDVGFLKEILVAPISRTSIVLGRIAGGSTTSMIQAVMILVLSIPLGFRVETPHLLPVTALVLVLLAMTFVGFGIAVSSQFQDSEGYGLIIQLVIFPLFFLSGALYPVNALPAGAYHLSLINPLTYGVDALRYTLTGSSMLPIYIDIGVLLMSSVFMVSLGAYLFSRVEAA